MKERTAPNDGPSGHSVTDNSQLRPRAGMEITRKFLGQESFTGSVGWEWEDMRASEADGEVVTGRQVRVRGPAVDVPEAVPHTAAAAAAAGRPLGEAAAEQLGVVTRAGRNTCTVRFADSSSVDVSRDRVAVVPSYFAAELPRGWRAVFQKMQFGRAMYFLSGGAVHRAEDDSVDPLPSGWEEIVCPASGIRYFKNALTDERMWQDPRPRHRRPLYLPDPRPIFQLEAAAPGLTAREQSHADSDDAERTRGCFAASSTLHRRGGNAVDAPAVLDGQTSPLAYLPDEIFEAALSLLDPRSLSRASCVCRHWCKIISRADATLWRQQWLGFGWVLECGIWDKPGVTWGDGHTRPAAATQDTIRVPECTAAGCTWRTAFTKRVSRLLAAERLFPPGHHVLLRQAVNAATVASAIRMTGASQRAGWSRNELRVLVISPDSLPSDRSEDLRGRSFPWSRYDIIGFEPGTYSSDDMLLRDGSALRFDHPVSIIGLGSSPLDVRLHFPVSLQAESGRHIDVRDEAIVEPSWVVNCLIDVRRSEAGGIGTRPSAWALRVGGAGVQTRAVIEDSIVCGGLAQAIVVRSSWCAIRFTQVCRSVGEGVSVQNGSHCAIVESFVHSNGRDGISLTGSSAAKLVSSIITNNRGNGFHAANSAATDISAGCQFVDNALYGLRLTGASSTAIIGCEVERNANGVLVSGRAHALLRSVSVSENSGHGVQLNSWACVVLAGGKLLRNGKKSLKLSSSARNKQGYLTIAGSEPPVLSSKATCTASFGCKSNTEVAIATSIGVLYFLLAPAVLLLCLMIRGEMHDELLHDVVATTAVGLHMGSGLVWLALLPIISTCGVELEVNAPSYIRHIETVAGFAQVNGLALFFVRLSLFWNMEPSFAARAFCIVTCTPAALILFFCVGFLVVFLCSPLINCVARRRGQCCGVVIEDGQQAINIKKCWEDLRMTGLSVLLYLWVVGPLSYVLAFTHSRTSAHTGSDGDASTTAAAADSFPANWPWDEHAVFCLGLLLMFLCHTAMGLVSMLDPRWSLFWGFTPEASWRGVSPPPDLLLLTRSYTGSGSSNNFVPDPNAAAADRGRRSCCRRGGLFEFSNVVICWALVGETAGYLAVIVSSSGPGGLLWGDEAIDGGTTFLFLASGLFPLLLTVLSAWDTATMCLRRKKSQAHQVGGDEGRQVTADLEAAAVGSGDADGGPDDVARP